jgi:phosphoglucosamine mutase
MQRKYFGTDGIRGQVGEPPITPDLMMKLGWAAGRTLVSAERARRGDRPGVLIGKDTRISGYMIEAALEAGLSAAGVDVYLCGPLPTPGIAYLTRALRLSAGIVISASHNPFDDNGIKFFSAAGAKLADDGSLHRTGDGDCGGRGCVPGSRETCPAWTTQQVVTSSSARARSRRSSTSTAGASSSIARMGPTITSHHRCSTSSVPT